MDEYSWNRRDELLSFEARAEIRLAIKKQFSIDDEYGADGFDHGFGFWFYRFKPQYWIKNRRKVGRYVEGHLRRAQKRRNGELPEPKSALDEIFGDDD